MPTCMHQTGKLYIFMGERTNWKLKYFLHVVCKCKVMMSEIEIWNSKRKHNLNYHVYKTLTCLCSRLMSVDKSVRRINTLEGLETSSYEYKKSYLTKNFSEVHNNLFFAHISSPKSVFKYVWYIFSKTIYTLLA